MCRLTQDFLGSRNPSGWFELELTQCASVGYSGRTSIHSPKGTDFMKLVKSIESKLAGMLAPNDAVEAVKE